MNSTVVVSCYNQENYIAQCLDSILSQDIDFNCQILVSDDCSTDSTPSIVAEFRLKYPDRITLILHQKNRGYARNYIEAHKLASGDIVFHFDGDDIMLPGKLKKQYDLFKKDESINLVIHRAEYFSDDGTYSSVTGVPVCCDNEVMYFDNRALALWGTIAVHSSYAYRKSSRKLYDPKREFMEWFFAMDSLMQGGCGAYINEVLVKYRCNPKGSVSYLSTNAGRARAYSIYLYDVKYYFSQCDSLRSELYANYLVTSAAILKARCASAKGMYLFIIKNIKYFKISNVMRAVKMRLAVAPKLKVRK